MSAARTAYADTDDHGNDKDHQNSYIDTEQDFRSLIKVFFACHKSYKGSNHSNNSDNYIYYHSSDIFLFAENKKV